MGGVVIVRVGGEIGVKSRPVRKIYESMLARIIRSTLERDGIPFTQISRAAGRIYVYTDAAEKASKRVAHIFGVSSASAGIVTSSELDEIIKKGVELAIMKFRPGSFAVRCRRSGRHNYTSMEVASSLGEAILNAKKNLRVDLENPDQTLFVEIRDDKAYFYFDSVRGPDGFPVGTQDPLLGIIDDTKESLLASWCMLKRGVLLKAVTYEIGGEISEVALNNLKILMNWVPNAFIEAFVIPLSTNYDVHLESYKLYAAATVAKKEGILGIVSGLRPKSISALVPLYRLDVQFFFPLMALEDDILDQWSRYIGIGTYYPDERVHEAVYPMEDNIIERIYSQSRYRRVTLTSGSSHF